MTDSSVKFNCNSMKVADSVKVSDGVKVTGSVKVNCNSGR